MRKVIDNAQDHDKSWDGVIITQTGVEFDIRKPTVEMIYIFDIAHSLSLQCRYNGHVPSFYSVAEHSVRVAQYLDETGHAELVFAGLLHDSAEAYIGDMVHPMKRLPQLGQLYAAYEADLERVIGEKFNVDLHPIHPLVKEADHAVYRWEVDNIRTLKSTGLSWRKARDEFLEAYLEFGGTA